MGFKFNILYQDSDLVAVFKPSGFHVHQPEFPARRVPKEIVCLNQLRDQLGMWVYPAHRLDCATAGVLLFALNKEMAKQLGQLFTANQVKKKYFAVIRGFLPDEGVLDEPMYTDTSSEPVETITEFKTHSRVEFPVAVGKRHTSARYSLVEAKPHTGRYHQIRRHFAHKGHPVLGDRAHGDSYHNRYFREQLSIGGLRLLAKSLEFQHPVSGESLWINCDWPQDWLATFEKCFPDFIL